MKNLSLQAFPNRARSRILATLASSACMLALSAQAQVLVDFTESSGYGLDEDRVMLENIRVEQELANPFDPERPELITSIYNIPWTFDYGTVSLVPDLSTTVEVNDETQCAALDVYVTDASTGLAIQGAQVQVGGSYQVTDSTGQVSFTGLTSGSAQIEANATDYAEGNRPATLSCSTGASLGLALNPLSGEGALGADEVRIVLTWGENPRDLDSHLTGPNSGNDGSAGDQNRFHVYYSSSNTDIANLDVDDTTSYGPETITISPADGSSTLRAGLYRYSVHHYAGEGNISASGASVTLQFGNTTRYFSPPAGAAGDEDLWTVFELQINSNGAITVYEQNTIDTDWTGGSSSVQLLAPNAIAPRGEPESGIDIGSLPPK